MTTCSSSTWSTQGSTSCSSFSSGTGLVTGKTTPVSCFPGNSITGTTCSGTKASPSCTSGNSCIVPTSIQSCAAGYYLYTSGTGSSIAICQLCTPGQSCTGGSSAQSACTANTQYSLVGSGSCTTIPVGFTSNQMMTPQSCNLGQYTTASGVTQVCTLCPAGSYCSTAMTSATACSTGAGIFSVAGQYGIACQAWFTNWADTSGSLTSAAEIACAWGTYQPFSTTAACKSCDAGFSCTTYLQPVSFNSQIADAAKTACPTNYYSKAGYYYCNKIPWGFSVPLTSSPVVTKCGTGNQANNYGTCITCTTGQYCPYQYGTLATCNYIQYASSTTACTSCTEGSICQGTTQLTISAGQISKPGASNFVPCPPGFYCPTKLNSAKKSCGSYSKISYATVGYTGSASCTVGVNRNCALNVATCSKCTGGVCGTTIEWVQLSSINGGSCLDVGSSVTSTTGLNCQLTGINAVRDQTAAAATTTYRVAWWGNNQQFADLYSSYNGDCQPTYSVNYFGYRCDALAINNNVHCPAGYVTKIDQIWGILPPVPTIYSTDCGLQVLNDSEGHRGYQMTCSSTTGQQGSITYGIPNINPNAINAPYLTMGGQSTTSTYLQQISSSLLPSKGYACQDCPNNMFCSTSGSNFFQQLVQTNGLGINQDQVKSNGYCWGKDPTIKHYSANSLGVDDRRVPLNNHAYCFDANAPLYAQGSVVFISSYFLDHQPAVPTSNWLQGSSFAVTNTNQLLVCPFQSLSRTVNRNLSLLDTWNGIVGSIRLDQNYPVSENYDPSTGLITPDSGYYSSSYTSYAWFNDNEPNSYPWSYCRTFDTYFTQFVLNSHSQVQSAYEEVITDCTQYEYLTPNYPLCEPNLGGFVTPASTLTTHPSSATPTDTPLSSAASGLPALQNQYSQLRQVSAYTGIEIKDCPEYTYSKSTGGNSAFRSCAIGELTQCDNMATANYCHDGNDFTCPTGTMLKTSGTIGTINDCTTCAAGSQCGGSAQGGTCQDGYQCPIGTSNPTAYSAQPGETSTVNVVTNCQFGFCGSAIGPAATVTNSAGAVVPNLIQQCPDGYYNNYLTSYTQQWSQAGCSPNSPGTFTAKQNLLVSTPADSTRTSTCAAGSFCPEGTQSSTSVPCAMGTYFAGTGAKSQDSCSDCSAGNFCNQQSISATAASCAVGYYCTARTIFQKDYPCPTGLTSVAGGSSSASCVNGVAGSFYKEGSDKGDATLCGPAGYYCPAGQTRQQCPTTGQAAADGATCAACAAGSFCPPGAAATVCQIGFSSDAGQQYCTPVPAGKTASTTGTITAQATNAPNTKWTLAGDASSLPSTCPAGFSCVAGVQSTCAFGNFCAEGTAQAPVSAGSVQNQAGLMFNWPCIPGNTCAAIAGNAPTVLAEGSWSKQQDPGTTPNPCNDGYYCPPGPIGPNSGSGLGAGSIGPYQQACQQSYWRTGSATACTLQTAGQYYFYGLNGACPAGMYCTPAAISSTFRLFYSCPKGQYLSLSASNTQTSVASCTNCDGGYACLQPGAGAAAATIPVANPVAYQCAAGYFCLSGATSTTPYLAVSCDPAVTPTCIQNICPSGYYCGYGTTNPTACPAGYFSGGLGARTTNDCIICSQGFYCPSANSRIQCDAGIVCPQTPTPSSTQNAIAQAGRFSLAGFPADQACEPGSFSNIQQTAAQACTPCTTGNYCSVYGMDGTITVLSTCIAGSDCSQPGTIYPQMCTPGNYLNSATPQACVTCLEDSYCGWDGITAGIITANAAPIVSAQNGGKCNSGFKCTSGSPVNNPNIIFVAGQSSLTYVAGTTIVTGTTTYYLCPMGSYCLNTAVPVQQSCAIGTYMPRYGAAASAECLPCPPGYQCLTAGLTASVVCDAGSYCTVGITAAATACVAGQYCPSTPTSVTGVNAGAPLNFNCPQTTFSGTNSATTCTTCTAGSFCDTQATVTPVSCTAGYYCPAGTSTPVMCPEGQTTLAVLPTGGSATVANCAVPSSQYTYFKSPTVTGTINNGYQSTAAGNVDPLPTLYGNLCKIGSFCVGGVSTLCVAGTYCNQPGMTSNVLQCTAGFVCNAGCTRVRPLTLALDFGQICQPGYFCGQGLNPQQCPTGTWSNAYGIQLTTDCHPCPEGNYCDVVQLSYASMILKVCPAGYYCAASTSNATPAASATICPLGSYCPASATTGSIFPVPCAPGSYNTLTQQSTCVTCEIGNYCQFLYPTPVADPTQTNTIPAGSLSQKNTCPIGYSCPQTGLISALPCEAGFYQGQTGQSSCLTCTAGFYCPIQGLSAPIACLDRFYCPAGASNPTLCPNGYVCDITQPATQTVLTPCPSGYYCVTGIQTICAAGYLCISKAVSPTPTDGTTGRIANQGTFISAGDTSETLCLTGFYNSFNGAADITFCTSCPAGYSCPGPGQAYPISINCPAGSVCVGAVITPCVPGTYCTLGTLVMQICPPGTYQDQSGQTSCNDCTAGNYCLPPAGGTTGATGLPALTPCPAGFYCPAATSSYSINSCPIGTYGAAASYSSLNNCVACPSTFYCPEVAMISTTTAPQSGTSTYPCKDGYICAAGSSSAIGSSLCPIDSFCTLGVASQCPVATYSTIQGLMATNECTICSPGYICPQNSIGIIPCPAGSYCPGNHSSLNDPLIQLCPAGSYCTGGNAIGVLCYPGTYATGTGSQICTTCDAGSYCPSDGMTAPTSCSIAYSTYYCPAGSIYPQVCPPGTYSSPNQQTCISCAAGNYCWPDPTGVGTGMVGLCAFSEGYICQTGSMFARSLNANIAFIQPGSTEFSTYNGPALSGYYAAQSGNVACAVGQFNPSLYGQSTAVGPGCLTCYQGRFCPTTAMQSVTGSNCNAGYFCKVGVTTATPVQFIDALGNLQGDICPYGKFCPFNLDLPQQCPDGFFSNTTGLSLCNTCAPGYYCDNVNNANLPAACIPGSACSQGFKRQPLCPSGTYFNKIMTACTNCTQTNYCRAGKIADNCAAGYTCPANYMTTLPNPAQFLCQAGTYCGYAATIFTYCPFGTMSPLTGARQQSDCLGCQPGYLCPYGTNTGVECPQGSYCPIQNKGTTGYYTQTQYPCPVGTFNSNTKVQYEAGCQNCTAGFYCNTTGTVNITNQTCPMGYYCPTRTIQPLSCPPGTFSDILGLSVLDDCQICPPGYFCTENTVNPIECDDGYYCPMNSTSMLTCNGGYYCSKQTQYQQWECPVNFYCPRGSKVPIPCDSRYTCPFKTEWQINCPNGYFVENNSQYMAANVCVPCDSGTYSIQTTPTCQQCTAGFLCYGATSSDHPISPTQDNGELCPRGYYCPTGTLAPVSCPSGTYNNDLGAKSEDDCHLCAPNTYNANEAQLGCRPCGQFASSFEGADACTCIGNYRSYSPVDSSCRCMSGFDYYNTQGVSQGTSSSIYDCIPLVLDRCQLMPGYVRDPTGGCFHVTDCSAACNGGSGVRSNITGVCNCNNTVTVDTICNQNCRSLAPITQYLNQTFVQLTYPGTNQVQYKNLTQYADVISAVTCLPSASKNCTMKTVEMSSSGMGGNYNPPRIFTNQTSKSRLLYQNDDRMLQTIATEISDIANPVYCINVGDSFIFSIPDAYNYPQYMRNSVLNSNPIFDYGSFLNLQQSMLNKQETGDLSPTIFSFTYGYAGSFVFNNANNTQQIMIITVKGLGQNCNNPNAYIQTVSGDTIANQGVSVSKNIIQKPNYPLIAAMTILVFLGAGTIMLAFTYCLRKGWIIDEVNDLGYRTAQLPLNIHHASKTIFEDGNQFITYKSDLINSEEDDLDNVNMDIQQDLIDAGKKYVRTFDKKKQHHKKNKAQKRAEIETLLKEIEDLVNMLSSDSLVANMHWIDLDGANDKVQKQIEHEIESYNKQQQAQNDDYSSKQSDMLKEATDRERELYLKMKAEMLKKHKENYHNLISEDVKSKISVEHAIYDGGDVKSKNNYLVKQIELDQNLTSEEKENILKAHEARLNYIDSIMDGEKKRQEQELDRALKERLDRRRKAQEKLHSKEIKADCKQAEADAQIEMEKSRSYETEKLLKDHDEQQSAILSSTDLHLQRSQMQALEDLTQLKKRKLEERLKVEMIQSIDEKKAEIKRKYLVGPNTDLEFQQQIASLLSGSQEGMQNIIAQAGMERQQEEDKLFQKLSQKRKKQEQQLELNEKQFEQQLDIDDLIEIEIRDKKAQVQKAQQKMQALLKAKGVDVYGNIITDSKDVKAADLARKEALIRLSESKAKLFQIRSNVDVSIQNSNLLQQLKEGGQNMVFESRKQEEDQKLRLETRRMTLKARKTTQKKRELEELRVNQELILIEENQAEKLVINEDYLRNLFRKEIGVDNDSDDIKARKMDALTEFQQDQFLESLSGLLMKQLTEKESLLKLLINKYMHERLIEIDAIKLNFKIDYDRLQDIKESLNDSVHHETLKNLRLSEENLIRQTELNISKAHAEEECSLRKELDKKQMQEQIEFRNQMVAQQASLRTQLFGLEGNLDVQYDKKALEKFEQLKLNEQDRRIRNIELQKITLTNQVESELSKQYTDYDDLIRRKREQQKEIESEQAGLLNRIKERKDKLKKAKIVEGMSKEDQEKMLRNYENQLQQLDSAYITEQRRQNLLMKQKQELRKQRLDKVKKLKEQLESKPIQPIANIKPNTGFNFGKKTVLMVPKVDTNDELVKRLLQWKQNKKTYELKVFLEKMSKAAINLNENEIKIMIIKLIQVEKLLKEISKYRKTQASKKTIKQQQYAKVAPSKSPMNRPSELIAEFQDEDQPLLNRKTTNPRAVSTNYKVNDYNMPRNQMIQPPSPKTFIETPRRIGSTNKHVRVPSSVPSSGEDSARGTTHARNLSLGTPKFSKRIVQPDE